MEMIELQIQIFLLAVVGFVLGKKGVLNTETRDHLVDVILMVVLPCSILQSFEMELSPDILISTLNVFLISCGIQFFYWVWNRFFYKNAEEDKKICLKYATMVSNAGFIGMPVASAVYGSLGLLYASVFLLPQRVFMWSYGLSMFTTVSSREVVKKVLTHPCIIAVEIGLVLMLSQTRLTGFLNATVNSLASSNTAVSMLLIGSFLAGVKFRSMFQWTYFYYGAIRLVGIPLLVYFPCAALRLDLVVTGVSTVLAAMPAASSCAILASKYQCDEVFASKCVVFTTVLSMVTIPLWCIFLA